MADVVHIKPGVNMKNTQIKMKKRSVEQLNETEIKEKKENKQEIKKL